MRHKALNYRHLIDLKVIPGLDEVTVSDGHIEIGAACTHRTSNTLRSCGRNCRCWRNWSRTWRTCACALRARLGGNLCFAEPHSDPATLLLALEARLTVEGAAGSRELGMEELIAGAYSSTFNRAKF